MIEGDVWGTSKCAVLPTTSHGVIWGIRGDGEVLPWVEGLPAVFFFFQKWSTICSFHFHFLGLLLFA